MESESNVGAIINIIVLVIAIGYAIKEIKKAKDTKEKNDER